MREPWKSSDLYLEARRRIWPLLAPLWSRRRRWQRFLREFDYDPGAQERPLEEPSARDFIICGAPRTGTTMLAAALFQPPSVVTVMEPWDGLRRSPAELFASLRSELETAGNLRRGKLDVEALHGKGEVRWWPEGTATSELELVPDYLLGVKWPVFWRYLDLLPRTKFLVCLRHPFDVIGSYKRKGGRLALGLEYDIAFNRAFNERLLASNRRASRRRIALYDEVNSRLLAHLERDNVLAVRYERFLTDSERVLAEIGSFLGIELPSMPVALRPPKGRSLLTEEDMELIRKFCRTAEALGYSLDRPE